MKYRLQKTLCLAVLVACLTASAAAATHPISVEITYEGVQTSLSGHGFSLLLPEAWVVYVKTDSALSAGPSDDSRRLTVSAFENTDSYTLATLLAELSADSAYIEVQPVSFEGVPFIAYEAPGENLFGVITLSADASFLYFFTFSPQNDDAFRDLALQIMASLQLAEESVG